MLLRYILLRPKSSRDRRLRVIDSSDMDSITYHQQQLVVRHAAYLVEIIQLVFLTHRRSKSPAPSGLPIDESLQILQYNRTRPTTPIANTRHANLPLPLPQHAKQRRHNPSP